MFRRFKMNKNYYDTEKNMPDTKEEKERRYYNNKLIKEGIRDEMKKPHPINWMDFLTSVIGTALGFAVCGLIGTETLIRNGAGRFAVNVLIVTAMIAVVKLAAYGITKALRKSE